MTSKTSTDNNTSLVSKGAEADFLYFNYASSVYDDVEHFPNNREKQSVGINVQIYKKGWSRPYYVDVRGNMTTNGVFYVETKQDGWLMGTDKQSDRICHVCIDSGWAFEYDRRDMARYVKNLPKTNKLHSFNVFNDKFPFRTHKIKLR